MTRCPDAGALRAALDGERPDVRAHLAGCAGCRERSRQHATDAAFTAAVMVVAPPVVDVDAALAGVRTRTASAATALAARQDRSPRPSRVARAAAVLAVALLAGVVLTPGGRSATAALLDRFRAERVAVVPVDFATFDPTALEALVALAEIDGAESLQPPHVAHDLAEAAAIAGFRPAPLDTAALPADLRGRVRIFAHAPQIVRIVFADRPAVPAAIRNAVLVVHLPGAVVQSAGGRGDVPGFVRGEAGVLEVTTEGGPSLADLRDTLLALPGLPPETVEALRAIEDWETTLPLPVPVGHVPWEETTVHGRPALAFGDESGVGSALVWRDGERFVGVGGTLPLSEVRRLAEPR